MRFSKTTGCFYPRSETYKELPADLVEATQEEFSAAMEKNPGETLDVVSGRVVVVPKPVPSVDEIVAEYEAELDKHLDAVAVSHRYANRITFAMRAGYVGPYQAEGVRFAQWMDACNVQAFSLLGDVEAGTKPMPTIEDFIASLPVFVG